MDHQEDDRLYDPGIETITFPIPNASKTTQGSQTTSASSLAVPSEIASGSANVAVAQPQPGRNALVAKPEFGTDTEAVIRKPELPQNAASADAGAHSVLQPEPDPATAPAATHHHPADLEVAGDSDVCLSKHLAPELLLY